MLRLVNFNLFYFKNCVLLTLSLYLAFNDFLYHYIPCLQASRRTKQTYYNHRLTIVANPWEKKEGKTTYHYQLFTFVMKYCISLHWADILLVLLYRYPIHYLFGKFLKKLTKTCYWVDPTPPVQFWVTRFNLNHFYPLSNSLNAHIKIHTV